MDDTARVTLEVGPKGKKVVAVAPDWPGLERGAKTGPAAIDQLRSYLPRYADIAKLAGMDAEFAAVTRLDLVEEYPGTGSTDFWGISFAFSRIDRLEMPLAELERELRLMQAGWAFFDQVRSRVSADLQRGPRGGGRNRDQIVSHTLVSEVDMTKKLGVTTPREVLLTDEGLQGHREEVVDAVRAFHTRGEMARTWPLRYLVRHIAYHTVNHAWEMQDKDLTGQGM